jgi:hypothetical protein
MKGSSGALHDLVADRRAAVVAEWMEAILAGYPTETARFLRTNKDPFGNPVGAALREGLGTVLDGAVGAADDESLGQALDRIIRVRAVQDFSPSAAIGFLFELKPILHRLTGQAGAGTPVDRHEIDRKVDRVLAMAFDIYSSCREQVFEIRIRSIRDLSLKHLERLNEWRIRTGRSALPTDAESSPHEGRS